MPTDEAPNDVNEPNRPAGALLPASILGLSAPAPAAPAVDGQASPAEGLTPDEGEPERAPLVTRSSRWVDYDTHELLEMIGELEDERRWARLREGVWLALLLHILLISAVTWIPRYVFQVPPVVDPFDAIKQRKDLTYLDLPPDALRQAQPKAVVKPVPKKPVVVDKQTMEAMKRMRPPAPEREPQSAAPEPARPPTPSSQPSQIEAPRPAAVPGRPNFAMNTPNPGEQLREALRGASRYPGMGSGRPSSGGGGGGLAMHPGAGAGGVEILSDTQGVDFKSWIQHWHRETLHTWDPLIPDEVNPPILKSGQLMIRFKVLPSGRLMDGSLILETRSGDVALDRAAWGALTGSNYPPLPRDFHGPYLELRAWFLYNMEPPR
jgi:outer membrane biosynthesis protein TonB